MTAIGLSAVPRTNYRIQLAVLLPALQLAYFILIWPLIYAQGIETADLTTGPIVTQSFALNRVFFPAMAAIAVMLLIAERHRIARVGLSGYVLFGGFLVYLGLSAAWALAPSTSFSKFILLAMQIIAVLPGVLLAQRADQLIRPMFWVVAVTLLVNLMAVVVLPATPIGHAGIYSHKNTLGSMMALTGLFSFYGMSRGNWRVRAAGVVMLPLVLLLLYLSRSKTSLALFLLVPFATMAAVFLRRYLRISLLVLLVVAAVPGALLLLGMVPGISFQDISLLASGDATFTGRTELWQFALSHIVERPLLGFGYQSFWDIGSASPAASMPPGFLQRAPHAHNGYLDLMLQGGVVALIWFGALLAMLAYWTDRVTDRDAGLGFFVKALLIYLLLLNLLETVWMQSLSELSMLTTMLMLLSFVRDREGGQS